MSSVVHNTRQQSDRFSPQDVESFRTQGYVVARGLADENLRTRMLEATFDGLARRPEPCEYEAELQYPGAPPSLDADGGRTIRRLKQAHARDPVFTEWLVQPGLVRRLQQLVGRPVCVPLAHHNCIMTKQPRHSSDTGWHRDIRYWSFEKPELVSVWLALGHESAENGGLKLIPGSHRLELAPDRCDEAVFLRTDHPDNDSLTSTAVDTELEAGDVLFFHCRTFHAATRNRTDEPKFSVVFTCRSHDNHALPGTRSASLPDMVLPVMP